MTAMKIMLKAYARPDAALFSMLEIARRPALIARGLDTLRRLEKRYPWAYVLAPKLQRYAAWGTAKPFKTDT
jgi:hypothetical protein